MAGRVHYFVVFVEDEFAMQRADGRVVQADTAARITSYRDLRVVYRVRRYDCVWVVSFQQRQSAISSDITGVHIDILEQSPYLTGNRGTKQGASEL